MLDAALDSTLNACASSARETAEALLSYVQAMMGHMPSRDAFLLSIYAGTNDAIKRGISPEETNRVRLILMDHYDRARSRNPLAKGDFMP